MVGKVLRKLYKTVKNVFYYIRYPRKLISRAARCRLLSDKTSISIRFWAKRYRKPDFANPKTFNEKIQWSKLYDRNPLYTKLSDKYEVRDYIAQAIGEEHLIPCYGVWDSFDEIDFDILPERFVLKCTHDCGSVTICKDKATFDFDRHRKRLTKKLKYNHFWAGRQWQYKDIKPRIIAEEYIGNSAGELTDYKFLCFGGVPYYCQIDFDRWTNHTRDMYNMNWELEPWGLCFPRNGKYTPRPAGFEKMKEIAGVLCRGFPHVRVDLYDVDGRVYFGELTFSHGDGTETFDPEEYDAILGALWPLPVSGDCQ